MPDDLQELERRRLAALAAGDLDAMDALHADDYELITPGGNAISKAEYVDGIASGELRYRVFEPVSPVKVRAASDTAIARYHVHIDIDFGDDHDEGVFWHTDYWERRNGRWQAVGLQATRIREHQPGG